MDFYNEIFKRKSFHLFKETEKISEEELREIEGFITKLTPLCPEIKTEIKIVKEKETTCKRGGEYCLLFYSEIKDKYLRNIGFLGEQVDLYLASKNIGALWYGVGKTEIKSELGLDFVIMINISKMPEEKFRKDMFKAKRKALGEVWVGESLNIENILRFAPSACNTQPWITENLGGKLSVYRYKKPGKRGIMPANKVIYYNRIDMGIYLYFLETLLKHENISFERKLLPDNSTLDIEKTLIAEYIYKKEKCR